MNDLLGIKRAIKVTFDCLLDVDSISGTTKISDERYKLVIDDVNSKIRNQVTCSDEDFESVNRYLLEVSDEDLSRLCAGHTIGDRDQTEIEHIILTAIFLLIITCDVYK